MRDRPSSLEIPPHKRKMGVVIPKRPATGAPAARLAATWTRRKVPAKHSQRVRCARGRGSLGLGVRVRAAAAAGGWVAPVVVLRVGTMTD
jgi:hypothetical protein